MHFYLLLLVASLLEDANEIDKNHPESFHREAIYLKEKPYCFVS